MSEATAALGSAPARAASDAELLGRWLATRDGGAFARLVERHGPLVHGVCRRRLPSPFDAEDAFQATFMTLAQNAERLRNTPTLAPWLHRVAWRTTANLRRRLWWRRWRTGPLPEQHPATAEAEPGMALDLDAALLSLPPRDRAAVLLCHVQGHSRREAAAALGCPEGTLSAILNRAMGKLRRRLRAHDPAAALSVAAVPLPLGLGSRTATAATAVHQGAAAAISAGLAPQAWSLAKGAATMEILRRAGVTAAACGLAILALAAAWRLPADDGPAKGGAKPPQRTAAASKSAKAPAVAAPAEHDPTPRELAARPAVNSKIAAALRAPTTMAFREKPLAEALDELAALHGIAVFIDQEGLQNAMVEKDRPMTMNLSGLPLEEGLALLLEPLNLIAYPRGGVLCITDAQGLKSKAYPRVYPVADLLVSKDNPEVDPHSLMKTLRGMVHNDDWAENGGAGQMTFFAPALSLAVTTHYVGHREIERSLKELRAARQSTIAALHDLDLEAIDRYSVKEPLPEAGASPGGAGGTAEAGGGGLGGGAGGGLGGGGGGLGLGGGGRRLPAPVFPSEAPPTSTEAPPTSPALPTVPNAKPAEPPAKAVPRKN